MSESVLLQENMGFHKLSQEIKSNSRIANKQQLRHEWEKAFLESNQSFHNSKVEVEGKDGSRSENSNSNYGLSIQESFDSEANKTTNNNSVTGTVTTGNIEKTVNPVTPYMSGKTQSSSSQVLANDNRTTLTINTSENSVTKNTDQLQKTKISSGNGDTKLVVQTPSSGNAMKNFHIYRSENGLVKVWLREHSSNEDRGMKLLNELKGLFQKMGLQLASFSLNGKTIFDSGDNPGRVVSKLSTAEDQRINSVV